MAEDAYFKCKLLILSRITALPRFAEPFQNISNHFKIAEERSTSQRPICEQCGKPAVGSARDVDLCVDCLYKLQLIESSEINNAMRRANQAIASMEMITGVTGYPRYQVPEPSPIIQRGPMNFPNIKIDRSVVGAINSGDVQRIEVAMNNIQALGGEALAGSLKEFTEAVLAHATLTAEVKNDVVEQVSFLATQVQSPQREKPGVFKSVMSNISNTVATASSIASLWEKLAPLLRSGLGL